MSSSPDRSPLLRRLPALLPVAVALLLWGAASALVLLYVARAEIFIMAEVRRHGLVPDLVAILLWFATPYLFFGAACAWTARGLRRLAAHPGPPGWRDGLLGTALLIAVFAVSTVLALVERPAAMVGLFYLKGGLRRWFQLSVERLFTPTAVARLGLAAAVMLFLLAAWGWLRHGSRRNRALSAVLVGGAAVAAVVLAAGAGGGRIPAGGMQQPSVLLVLVDSLRPDRVDPASPDALPTLSRLATDGARFADARTPLARTYPSVASLLTGLHPLRHGVRTLYPSADRRRLPDTALPRVLEKAGWTTAAVGGYCATALRGLDAGYRIQTTPRSEASLIITSAALAVHPLMTTWMRTPLLRAMYPQVRTAVEGSVAEDVAAEAISTWRRIPGPFFMTVFFDNAHMPYVPNWPETLTAGDYDGPNRYSITAGDLVEQVRAAESATQIREQEREKRNALRLYQGALTSVDRAVARMLRALRRDGRDGDTLVIVLGDHGENLLDAAGTLAHGLALEKDDSNAIALIMNWPQRLAPQVVADPVDVTDIMPTVLRLLDLPAPAPIDGRSQAARLAPGHEPAAGGAGTGAPGTPAEDFAQASPAETDEPRLFLQETGIWFFSRDMVRQLAPGEDGLTYPDFTDGLLTVEPGHPPHVVVSPAQRQAVMRAKHRRLEAGPWALVYRPATDGAHFSLYRRDRDPWLTQDLAPQEPEELRRMMGLFYTEAGRLGETELLPPAGERPGGEMETVEEPTEAFAGSLHRCSRAILAGSRTGMASCFAAEVDGTPFPRATTADVPERFGLTRHGWAIPPAARGLARKDVLGSLTQFLAHFSAVEDLRLQVTEAEIQDSGEGLTGRVALELVGRDRDGRREWLRGTARVAAAPAAAGAWPLRRLVMEQADSLVAPRDLFVDVAAAAGLAATDPPVLEHATLGLAAYGGAAADVNNDGLMDLFSTGDGGNFLYLNQGDGTFREVAAQAFVKVLPRPAAGALFLDHDGDGDQDLFLSSSGPQYLLENRLVPDGALIFRDISHRAGVDRPAYGFSIAAGDLTGDGLTDLYVASYNDYGRILPDSWDAGVNGSPNLLFVNQGDGTFREAAAAMGMDDPRWSYAAGIADVDGDSDLDLYVANDFGGGNSLFIQDGGAFSERARQSGVDDNGYSMGISFGDPDRDGDLDLHVTRMSSTAGLRILDRLAPWSAPGRDRLRRLTAGNGLYENQGDGTFREVSGTAGPFLAGWAWGGGFLDIDNDGFEDLHVPNGFLSGELMSDTQSLFWRQVVVSHQESDPEARAAGSAAFLARQGGLLREGFSFSGFERDLVALNRGDGTFLDISGVSGADSVSDGRGAVYADVDNDGDLDIFLRAMHGDAHFLYENRTGQENNWLRISLEGRASGPDAYGAVVRVGTPSGLLTRLKAGGSGFLSQPDPRLLFGLGRDAAADWIEVVWPSGQVDRLPGAAAGMSLRLVEGESSWHTVEERRLRLPGP